MSTRSGSGRTYANVMATLAVFLSLAGGAYAVTTAGKNTVVSRSIKNGQVRSVDLRDAGVKGIDVKSNTLGGREVDEASLALSTTATPTGAAGGDLSGSYPNPEIGANTVTGAEVVDGSLGGADILESSLGEVPNADQVDGVSASQITRGASDDDASCNPEMVLTYTDCASSTFSFSLNGRVLVIGTSVRSTTGQGNCRLEVDNEEIPGTAFQLPTTSDPESFSLTGVSTTVYAPGSHTASFACNQTGGDISFSQSQMSAVAIGSG
jgi:hypothetical protein